MDADFINTFVQKQRDMISELTNRCLVAETKISLAEAALSKAAALEQELAALKADKEGSSDVKKKG